MPDDQSASTRSASGKKDLKIRDVAITDHDALDRIARRLGLKREAFTRVLLHRAIWKAHVLFEMEIREALGSEPETESESQEGEEGNNA